MLFYLHNKFDWHLLILNILLYFSLTHLLLLTLNHSFFDTSNRILILSDQGNNEFKL